ncbi:MAG: hypothetical protein Q4P15_08460 [Propionibacteriaceae bacterium]|nr:hypothetical protein [Propionibacteriaceae bacterium]
MAEVPNAPSCERFRTDLSAFADETLPSRKWHQVGYHVAGCPACREELASIRSLRSTLQTPRHGSDGAPQTLEQRLQRIAGEHIDAPLYMAAGPKCALPTRRRVRTRRMVQSGVAAITVMASMFVIAFLLAPEPPVISNAVKHAREQYSLSTTATSVNASVGAVLLAHERGAAFGVARQKTARSIMGGEAARIPRATAAALLDRESPTHSGTQRVWVSAGGGQYHVADVRVDEVAGEGTSLAVLDSSGNRFMSWFVPSGTCCKSDAGPPWTFWKYRGMDQVAGRWANVVEARDENDRRVARWWLDCDDGLILFSERYDSSGTPTIMSGFTKITMGEAHLADADVETTKMNPVSSSGTKGWCLGLEHCPADLAGLPLVAHAPSYGPGGKSMRLFYSDGFRGLSVVWSEGQLEGEPQVTDRTAGFPDVAVWQVRDGIVSVATSNSPELLEQASAQLPGLEPWAPSVWERVGRGLARLAGIN